MLATDFGALPPEVTSALLYMGPGSGPMLTAATAWESLTAVLNSAAVSYASVVSALTLESWLGPASASMAAAAAPYAEWLIAAAEQARQTAAQASAAAAAYETARASAVPPPVIAANRGRLASLVTMNTFGQNTPAIETLQAEYAEMWAQDAAVMYQYAEASETASTLTPFSQPAHAADPTAAAAQAAQAAQATDAPPGQVASIGTDTLQALPPTTASAKLTSELPAPAASIPIPTPIGELDGLALYIAAVGTSSLSLSAVNTARPWYYNSRTGDSHGGLGPTHGTTLDLQSPERRNIEVLVSSPSSSATAGLGQAALVGGLSVPHGWTMAAPEIKLAVESLPSAGLSAAPTDMGGAPAGLLSGMALASLAGRGAGGTGPRVPNEAAAEDGEPKRKPTVVVIQQPPPAGGTPGNRPR
ncbi:PPE family protein [Mycobacterium ostraviense]|nr:PPE family protein [Mycobacterium ostraviense]